MIVYRTPYRNVIINKRTGNLVGLTYSGGADSVILLYCLVANGYLPDRLLYSVTDLPGGEIKTKAMENTLKYIESKFNVDLESRLIKMVQTTSEMERMKRWRPMEECDVLYTGTTQNPQVELAKDLPLPDRVPTGMVNSFARFENPFGTFDKRATIYLYNLLGVNDLLEITRSCHSLTVEPCGKCFHCLERKWAIEEVQKLKFEIE